MKLTKLIENTIAKYLNETWYHGTYDAREIEKAGGFTSRTKSVDYVEDID